jgi:hypothetical protein
MNEEKELKLKAHGFDWIVSEMQKPVHKDILLGRIDLIIKQTKDNLNINAANN